MRVSKPLVAVVGRPNVGKSTLFNRLVGERVAIVQDTPGITRDRVYGECEWRGRIFRVVDTGGLGMDEELPYHAEIREQAELALEEAEAIYEDQLRLCIVGRPNVGKSSLLNAIVGDERVIVSDVPGTTRDAVDVPFELGDQRFLLVDTAGIRRPGKVQGSVEFYM